MFLRREVHFAQSGFAVRKFSRSSIARGRLSGTAPRIPSSRLKITLRCQREARRLPPSDSYTGVMRPTSSRRVSASSLASGRTSNCGWIILKLLVDRDGSTLPYTATVCPA